MTTVEIKAAQAQQIHIALVGAQMIYATVPGVTPAVVQKYVYLDARCAGLEFEPRAADGSYILETALSGLTPTPIKADAVA